MSNIYYNGNTVAIVCDRRFLEVVTTAVNEKVAEMDDPKRADDLVNKLLRVSIEFDGLPDQVIVLTDDDMDLLYANGHVIRPYGNTTSAKLHGLTLKGRG